MRCVYHSALTILCSILYSSVLVITPISPGHRHHTLTLGVLDGQQLVEYSVIQTTRLQELQP